MRIFHIDPGQTESGYAVIDGETLIECDKLPNLITREEKMLGGKDVWGRLWDHLVECEGGEIDYIFSIETFHHFHRKAKSENVIPTLIFIGECIGLCRSYGLGMQQVLRKDIEAHYKIKNADCDWPTRCNTHDSRIAYRLRQRYAQDVVKVGNSHECFGFYFANKGDMWQAWAGAVYVFDTL